MYKEYAYQIGRFKVVSLRNEVGTGIDLIPTLGGAIHQVYLTNKAIPLLDPFLDEQDLEENSRYKQAILFPFPNRLKDGKYSFKENTYQFPINEPDNNNALHGFLYNKEMQVSEVNLHGEYAELKLTYQYLGKLEYYPFPCSIELVYKIDNESLKIDFLVKNTGSSALPYGFGWHPYFKSDNVMQMAVPEGELQVVDNRNLPTGEDPHFSLNSGFNEISQKLDNCFKMPKKTLFTAVVGMFHENKIVLKADDSVRFFQIYTPEMDLVALEPVTCNIDAFNSKDGLIMLQPGVSRSHQISLSIA